MNYKNVPVIFFTFSRSNITTKTSRRFCLSGLTRVQNHNHLLVGQGIRKAAKYQRQLQRLRRASHSRDLGPRSSTAEAANDRRKLHKLRRASHTKLQKLRRASHTRLQKLRRASHTRDLGTRSSSVEVRLE